MLRALLALILAALLAWLVRRSTRRPVAPRTSPPEPAGGPMVRDRICDTFLPRDRAIELRQGSESLFFCSDACRDRYLAQRQAGR